MTFGEIDHARVARALDSAYSRALLQEKEEGIVKFDLSGDQYVFFSDQHKGARNGADDFQIAEPAYLAALQYYNRMNYTLVTLGDVEELWEEYPRPVINAYGEVFDLEAQFHQANRYIRIWGNHDDNWRYPDQVRQLLDPIYGGKPLQVREVLILRVFDEGKKVGDILMLHGHHGTLDSDYFRDVSRHLIRYIWRPIQRMTKIPSNTPATDWKLRHTHNIALYKWTEERRKMLLISGHTHRPVFKSVTDKTQIQRQISTLGQVAKEQPQNQELKQELSELEAEWQWIQKESQYKVPKEADLSAELERPVIQRKPSYFNTGCCCYPDGDITGIEIVGGEIRLVRWPDNDGQLNRQVLARSSLRDVFNQC